MKTKTKVAIIIAVGLFLTLILMILIADNQFEQTGKSVSFKWELAGEEISDLKEENKLKTERLEALNADLTVASVVNRRLKQEADSTISHEKKVNALLNKKLNKSYGEIDSLRAVIRSMRQSDI